MMVVEPVIIGKHEPMPILFGNHVKIHNLYIESHFGREYGTTQ